ncbi:MAG TPA: extracellular solute-binding protein [Anaerolineales bacterium]|nr:extracellular solute-binding protein [Anaerolineales bacterium]
MHRRMLALFSVLLVAAFALSACGGGSASSGPVTLTIWHGYHAGGSEEATINKIVSDYQAANPNVKLTVLEVPFDQLYNKWDTSVAAGQTTPDMFTAPNDNLGSEVRAGTIAPIDALVQGKLTGYTQAGINGVTVDGKIYAVPGIAKAVGLFYNTSTIPNPPKTTDDLMALVKSGKKFGFVNNGGYYMWGFWSAFGGTLMDSSGKCSATQGGFADALQYLADLQTAGGTIYTDEGKADTAFEQGQLDMIIEGPWELGDFEKALGSKLGVVPGPNGPKGAFMPMMGIDGWYINPNSKNQQAAIAFALYAFGKDGLTLYENNAGDPAARSDVTSTDPLVKAFADIAAAGYPRPQSKEFGNYWGPFGDAMTAVFGGKAAPADAVTTACAAMDKANGK